MILKPKIGAADHLAESAERVRHAVKAAAKARLGKLRRFRPGDSAGCKVDG